MHSVYIIQSDLYDNYSETRTFIHLFFIQPYRYLALTALPIYPDPIDHRYFTIPTTLSTFLNRNTRRPTTLARALPNSSHKCHQSEVGKALTRRLVRQLRHWVVVVHDQTILHEKSKFPNTGLCFTVIISKNNYKIISWAE